MSALRGLESVEAVEGGPCGRGRGIRRRPLGPQGDIRSGHSGRRGAFAEADGPDFRQASHRVARARPNAPNYINTLDQRVELIRALGIEDIIVAEFDRELAALTKEEFVRWVLIDALDTRHLVVGANFRFGKDREGDVRYLSRSASGAQNRSHDCSRSDYRGQAGQQHAHQAVCEPGRCRRGREAAGQAIRPAGHGRCGRQVGRTIGFPTANIETGPKQLAPGRGSLCG